MGDQSVRLHVGAANRLDQFRHLLDTAVVEPGFKILDDCDQRRGVAKRRVVDADVLCKSWNKTINRE